MNPMPLLDLIAKHESESSAAKQNVSSGYDVVVGPVEGRPHEIGCRGIYPHIAAIGVLDMEDLSDQMAMWRQHEAA